MTTVTPGHSHDADDIRPIVGRDSGNQPLWFGLAAILCLGVILFAMLDSQRRGRSAPPVRPRAADLARSPSPVPPLFVPPERRVDFALPDTPPQALQPMPLRTPAPPRPFPTPPYVPERYVAPPPPLPPAAPRPVEASSAIVYDTTAADTASGVAGPGTGPVGQAPLRATRARAARLSNRETTIMQGTLIAAVLETALDSTQPGQTRALVSRDVTSVDGSRTLVPRGSRLFGEYRAELGAGQKRAQVLWTRLVRPDGVAIALDSPAADRLGRAGIRGSVNTHFFERLGNALLQSSVGVGSAVATRAISDTSVIVALPNAAQGAAANIAGETPKPTLTVRAGTRISVFVARDLDFSGVDRP